MEAKNNIIRRALEQAPDTQLPEGFCERLMERLERESARRERRETWLLGTAGVLCLLAVIAGLAWYFWYEPGVGLHLPDMPSLPRHTRVARPGLHTTSRTGFPGRKQAAVPVLRLYRRNVPRPRRARPLPAQAQAQCYENKRAPAPINRADRGKPTAVQEPAQQPKQKGGQYCPPFPITKPAGVISSCRLFSVRP